jgi:uncharacterized membrane protein
MLPEWAPDLLAFAGHAPLALLILGVCVDLITLLRPKWESGPAAATAAYVGALVAAFVVYLSAPDGIAASASPEALAVVETQSTYLWYTLLFTAVYGGIRVGVSFLPALQEQVVAQAVLAVIGMGGVYIAWQATAAHAQLVYRYGEGVEAVQQLRAQSEAAAAGEPQGFQQTESGWRLEPRTPGAWKQAMTWVSGSPTDVQSFLFEPEGSGPRGLAMYLEDETVLFAGPPELRTADIRATLNLDGFDGTVDIAYNVRGAAFYDYLQLDGNALRLARREGSATRIQDTADYALQGWRDYRIEVGRTTFQGFVGDQLVVTGTDTPASPGTVGLRLSGTGLVRMRSMSAEPLEEISAAGENDAPSPGRSGDAGSSPARDTAASTP